MLIPAEIYLDNPPIPPGHFAAHCAERFRAWRRKRRWMREMAKAVALGRLDEILADVGMTRAELEELMTEPEAAGLQFEKMAAMLGIDSKQFPAGAVNSAVHACIRCECRAACKRWLRIGTWHYDGDPRCPNAGLLRS